MSSSFPTLSAAAASPLRLKSADLATIPNLLSFARIAGVTGAVALYLGGHGWVAVVIGSVSALTDYLDGYLARRLKQETAFGALLDQAADSYTTAILLAMLVLADGISFAFLALFLLREFWVGAVRRYGAVIGLLIPSNALGKWATALLYPAVLLIAAAILPGVPDAVATPLRALGLAMLVVGLGLSCLAAWRYTLALTGGTA